MIVCFFTDDKTSQSRFHVSHTCDAVVILVQICILSQGDRFCWWIFSAKCLDAEKISANAQKKSKAQTERRSAWKTCLTKTQSIASCARFLKVEWSPVMFRNRTASLANLEHSWKTFQQACSFLFYPLDFAFQLSSGFLDFSIISIRASFVMSSCCNWDSFCFVCINWDSWDPKTWGSWVPGESALAM